MIRNFALMLSLVSSSAAFGGTITGIEIYDLGAGVVPNAINNNGYVVGKDSSGQAFVYYDGTKTLLGTLGGSTSVATDINDDEVVVVYSLLSNGKQHGFKYVPGGSLTDLNPGSAYNFTAEAVNSAGEAVGWAQNGSITRSTYWMLNGTTTYMFGSSNNKALGINNKGQIVGVRLNSSGNPDLGYYWDGNNGSASWTTGYYDYYPFAGISNNSVHAGQEDNNAAYLPVPAPDPADIGKLDYADLTASCSGISDNGSLTGGYSGQKALLYDITNHDLFNLNDMIPSSSSFTELNLLSDINNSGQFVGVGKINGVDHGYVGQTITVPEPGTLTILTCGLNKVISACFSKVCKLFSDDNEEQKDKQKN